MMIGKRGIWMAAACIALPLAACRPAPKKGIHGTYRVDANVVDDTTTDGLRTVKGDLVLTLATDQAPSAAVELKSLRMASGDTDQIMTKVPNPAGVNPHIAVPSVVRIPFSGHYYVAEPPELVAEFEVDGHVEMKDLLMEK